MNCKKKNITTEETSKSFERKGEVNIWKEKRNMLQFKELVSRIILEEYMTLYLQGYMVVFT